jgi:DNA/RNA-binding domain of Phe-tRNA-synthetase-like protein
LRNSLQHTGIGKVFLDMENMLVLADDDGIFGSSMSDSTRAMVTENAEDILVVIYCFENNIDLDVLLSKARNAFERFAAAENIDSWIYINRKLSRNASPEGTGHSREAK